MDHQDSTQEHLPPPHRSSEGRRDHSGQARNSILKYILLGIAIVAVSVVASQLVPESSSLREDNLVNRAVESVDSIIPTFESTDSQALAEFIRGQFEWDSNAPQIGDTSLRGVAVHEVIEGLELPAYVYEDGNGGQIVVYVISYRILDDRSDNLGIGDRVLKLLSDEYQLVQVSTKKDTQAVLWREYSFLFLAVSSNNQPSLVSKINPRRSP